MSVSAIQKIRKKREEGSGALTDEAQAYSLHGKAGQWRLQSPHGIHRTVARKWLATLGDLETTWMNPVLGFW